MGAIGGIVDFNNNKVPKTKGMAMIDILKEYKLNSIQDLYLDNIYMNAGIQYITEESYCETIPTYVKEENLILTVDAIIDNRDELIEILEIPSISNSFITDSQIIMFAHLKWGIDAPKFIIGDYSYAIYDKVNETLYLAKNHTGTRSLYYLIEDNKIYFSTVFTSILKAKESYTELNNRWICDYLSIDGPAHEVEVEGTLYKGIEQVPPATIIKFTKNTMEKFNYWDPLKMEPIIFDTDKEYIEEFLKVFDEAVKCKLRTKGNIGIMLSGGLDSGSVAVMAARNLQKEGKDLIGFSSIPKKNYKDNKKSHIIGNEKEYIESIGNMYDNVKLNYESVDNTNSYDVIDEVTKILESPFKVVENIYWNKTIQEKASEAGCKVLLNGQFGNSTISYGEFTTHILTEVKKGRLIKLFKYINKLGKRQEVSRKLLYRIALRVICPYKIRKVFYKYFRDDYNFLENAVVNRELAKNYNSLERLKSMGIFKYPVKYRDIREMREVIMKPIVFSHIGAIETKMSLAHGIVQRDPTRDKRIIEFCMNIPEDQYVSDGYDRNLIRRAMEGILPDKIRLNITKRGLQAVDWVERLSKDWDKIDREVRKYLRDERVQKYIEVNKVNRDLNTIEGKLDKNSDESAVRSIMITLVFSRFLIKKVNQSIKS